MDWWTKSRDVSRQYKKLSQLNVETHNLEFQIMGTQSNPARKAFFDAFRTHIPLYTQKGLYAPIYARSRLVLNQSAAGELNFRLFEAMGNSSLIAFLPRQFSMASIYRVRLTQLLLPML